MTDQRISPDLPAAEVPSAVEGVLADWFDEREDDVAGIGGHFTASVAALRDFTMQGGKRVRPAFAWAGWLACGGAEGRHADPEDPAAVLRAVSALEFIQACALVHDDIVDASDTRRGNPTVHRRFEALHRERGWRGDAARFGESVAILLGDVALTWADDMLTFSGITDPALDRARLPWWRMRLEVLGGQLLDITAEAAGDGRVETAERINTYKTAAYTIERPLHIGAAIAGAPEETVAGLRRFGRDIGIAFQLRDDQLGMFGDPSVTGKPIGDDLREGKRTVLAGTAIARLRETAPDDAMRLDHALGRVTDPAEIRELSDLIRSTGAVEEMEEEIAVRTERGLAALDDLDIDAAHRDRLRDMGRRATQRLQ
ncbi:polyprenyl synthetase family protein [Corynebacterium sp. 335C]